nr:MAG: hypothetical protein [Lake Baikal virophage 11]
MAIPSGIIKFAGTWSVSASYVYADLVVSPIDQSAYVLVVNSLSGGSDPSVPSADWFFVPSGGGVDQLVAGTNVTLTPPSGLGTVTIDATAGAGGVSQIINGTYTSVNPAGGVGIVAVDSLVQPSISGSGTSVTCTSSTVDVTGTLSVSFITTIPSNDLDIDLFGNDNFSLNMGTGVIQLNTFGTGKVELNLGGSAGSAGQVVGSTGDGFLQWSTPAVTSLVAGTNIAVTDTAGAWTIDATIPPFPVTSIIAGTNITVNPIDGLGNVTVNNTYASPVTSVIAGTNITSVTEASGAWTVNAASQTYTPFVDSFQIYVAPNGDDTTGTGSQQNPFLTIAAAIVKRATLLTTVEVSIVLSSGTYTESPTILANTYIVGVPTGEAKQPVNIIGTITMSGTSGSMGVSGLEITGAVFTTGAGATYTIFGCNITNTTRAINASAGDVFVTECRIQGSSGSNNTIEASCNELTIRDCVISRTGNNSTGSCIESGGTTKLFLRQCIISSTSASLVPSALVKFTNTGVATTEISFCKIEYTSGAGDVTSVNKCCIQFAGAGNITASIYNNLLICEGATTGTPQIQCIQDTGGGTVTLAYGQLIAGATAHNIAPAVTEVQYVTVP